MIEIRKANNTDKDEVWEIVQAVVSTGETYVFDPNSSKEKMLAYWFSADKEIYVAVSDNQILGTFFLKANQPDLGSHICNAGYMVSSKAKGQGIGRKMAEFSLPEAKRLGFNAMQFNFVVKSNAIAIKLWLSLGFEVIGEIPEAFQHKDLGLVDALIMYRKL